MPKAIMLGRKRSRIVFSDLDAERYVKSQPRACNRGYLWRQFRETKDEPTHVVLSGCRIVPIGADIRALI